ncbi:MAG: LysR substrate-binding domain-containing protein, partial [Alphaproteobacteria bacterium]
GYMINIQHARPIPEECDGLVLAEETFVPLANPAFVAEHGIETIADIGRVPIIHSIRCVVQWEQWVARFAPDARLNPRSMQFDRSYLAIGAAADGYGLVLESHLHAADFMRKGSLVMPFGPLGVTAVAHRLVYRREDRDVEEISAFVTWIMEEMAGDASKGTIGLA